MAVASKTPAPAARNAASSPTAVSLTACSVWQNSRKVACHRVSISMIWVPPSVGNAKSPTTLHLLRILTTIWTRKVQRAATEKRTMPSTRQTRGPKTTYDGAVGRMSVRKKTFQPKVIGSWKYSCGLHTSQGCSGMPASASNSSWASWSTLGYSLRWVWTSLRLLDTWRIPSIGWMVPCADGSSATSYSGFRCSWQVYHC